ncbi:MAG: hypothetical protein P8127_15415, partial [Acidobacteriota bacterium]
MAAGKKKKKSSWNEVQPWVTTAVGVAAVVVFLGAIWNLGRGRGEKKAVPFEDRLRELAEGRGVAAADILADDPIRKVGAIFVRTWKIPFPSRPARDGFIGDLEIEAASRGAEFAHPEDMGTEHVRLRVGMEVEAFDLDLVVKQALPTTV